MLVFYDKKSFYISKRLAENLDGFVRGVMKKNTSAVFLIDGRSGLGKTTLSSQVACYINNQVKKYYEKENNLKNCPKLTLDCMTWTPKDFLKKFESVRKGDVVILDESMILSNRSTMSEINRAVIIMMSMIRSKNIFVIFNVNSIFDLDKNLPLHRADMLINLYPREQKFASRGAYQVIPAAGGKLKNLYITGKKYYDYSRARKAFNDTFSGFFPFDVKEYERRKQEAINNYFESGQRKSRSLVKISRDRYIKYLNDELPITQDEIARIGNISPRTVQRAVADLREINLN